MVETVLIKHENSIELISLSEMEVSICIEYKTIIRIVSDLAIACAMVRKFPVMH